MSISIKKCQVFAEGLDHSEGLCVHPDGSLWAGGELGQIYRISPDGKQIKQVATTDGFSLGLAFSPDLKWLAVCDVKRHAIMRLDLKKGTVDTFAEKASSYSILIPNYPVFDRAGNLYVSDSGQFKKKLGKILKYDKNGLGEIWHNGPFNFANGMALAPDKSALYVVESFLPGITRIEINKDGSAGQCDLFAHLPKTVPDGLAFDSLGNLYCSCYTPNRIYRITPSGKVSILIDDWEAHTLSNPTNIAFGGPNFDDLFSTNLGRWHITKIKLGIRGAPLACHKK